MKRIKSLLGGLLCLLWSLQSAMHLQAQSAPPPTMVMSIGNYTGPVILTTAQNAFVSTLVAAAAIQVAQEVSEPLENYEVGLKSWTGHWSREYPNWGRANYWTYLYNPTTGTHFYQDVQRLWLDEHGTYYSDQTVYYTPFDFSTDNMDVWEFFPTSQLLNDATGYCEYYCKRNGSAWFGRPLRVHVYGYTWNPQWADEWTLLRIPTGEYSHHQWVYLPANSYATFFPQRVVNSYLGAGYATTFYEIF